MQLITNQIRNLYNTKYHHSLTYHFFLKYNEIKSTKPRKIERREESLPIQGGTELDKDEMMGMQQTKKLGCGPICYMMDIEACISVNFTSCLASRW
jgi:hypothetical protein